MRQSQLFPKTLRQPPSGEQSINAKLLEQGGFVHKVIAGVYAYLPLGWRVLKKIEQIIREEMDGVGGQELQLPALQPRELWEASGRWKTLGQDVMYQFQDHSGHDVGLGMTHEEVIADIAKRHVSSYRDLPFAVYQIQDKFRDEPRAKSGVLRGREFGMKDLYSFHATEADLDHYYEAVKQAYLRVFSRLGLTALVVEASGGAFSKNFSHEFQVISDAGEDRILVCDGGEWAQNTEIATPTTTCQNGHPVQEKKSIEVGNIFKLGIKFSEAAKLMFTDDAGKEQAVIMACYGIGPTRLLGTLVEVFHDEQGMMWPADVAPYQVHLLTLEVKEGEVRTAADDVYNKLTKQGIEVLYDERDVTPGVKFKDSDLLGIPWRVVIGKKTAALGKLEVKARNEKEATVLTELEFLTQMRG